jgi:hypothetical protein
MNTSLSYRYADKTDCRQFTSIVLSGTITWEQIAPYLASRSSFVPGQLGLEDLQRRFALPGVDHSWHQITSEDIKPTEAEPTVILTGAELAQRFAHTPWEDKWFGNGYALKATITDLFKPFDLISPTATKFAATKSASTRADVTRARKQTTRIT